MISGSKDFLTSVRRILAKILRSNVTMFLIPISLGIAFTAVTACWAFENLSFLREQTKRDIYSNLRLADAQINSAFDVEYKQLLTNSLGSPSPQSKGQIWTFDARQQVLKLANSNQKISLSAHPSLTEKARTNFSQEEFILGSWNQLQVLKSLDRTTISRYWNISLFDNSQSMGFSLPIISPEGQLLGVTTSSIPSSRIKQFLPDRTCLVDPLSGSYLSPKGFVITDLVKDRLPKAEIVPHELFSSARPLAQNQLFSDWKLWCDHPVSEIWSRAEVKRAIDFPSLLVIGIWLVVILLVKSASRVRDRQRRLIGSLVRRVIWITDEEGSIEYVLGKVTSQLGWKEVDYRNVNISLFVHPEDRDRLKQGISKALGTLSKDETVEIRFENKDREYRWYEVAISDMSDISEINGIVITAHDIEQRKHATDHIIASKRAAEKANEAKSEFLSRMSHELRTPLNAILGFGQLLEMEAITERQSDNVGQILVAGRHLLNLVNDILDIARIETRKVNLSVEKVNVQEVVEESFALLSPLAAKSNIKLVLKNSECPNVWADRQRLKQVMLNLISNAIKYNVENGIVSVALRVNDYGLHVGVSDTGIGIESHYMDRIFTPFDRLGSDTSDVEGSGLGLALSKTLVEAMGAHLEVQTEYGKGSTFTVVFKETSLVQPEPEEMGEVIYLQSVNPDDFKILLIEDNVVNLRYVSKVVERIEGVVLLSAKEGGIGIEMARTQNPDLILLDLDLPDLHGKEVLQVLRSDPKTASKRIVVMSAESNPHVIEQTLILGADQFVMKPVDVNSLLELFSEERNAA